MNNGDTVAINKDKARSSSRGRAPVSQESSDRERRVKKGKYIKIKKVKIWIP